MLFESQQSNACKNLLCEWKFLRRNFHNRVACAAETAIDETFQVRCQIYVPWLLRESTARTSAALYYGRAAPSRFSRNMYRVCDRDITINTLYIKAAHIQRFISRGARV